MKRRRRRSRKMKRGKRSKRMNRSSRSRRRRIKVMMTIGGWVCACIRVRALWVGRYLVGL